MEIHFPRGCVVIDDEIHVANPGASVYVYDLAGTHLRNESLSDQNRRSFGIAHNPADNEIFIADFDDNLIYVYDESYEFQTIITLETDNSQPEGLTFFDDLIWCVDRDKTVYPYSTAGVFDSTKSFDLPADVGEPKSITHAAGRFWIGQANAIHAYREDGSFDGDLSLVLTVGVQGLGVYNNQFIFANSGTDEVEVENILSGVSISINDDTQVVTVDSDEAWADHDITVLVTAHQDDFDDPTAEFAIRFEQHIPVWLSLASVTWTVDSAITEIDLNDRVSHEDSISIYSGDLPDGITFSNGVLSGTPTDSTDDVTLGFRATNDAGTADAMLAITINGAVPVWTALPAVTWTEDSTITEIDLTESVSGNPTPTIALQNSTLPDGVMLSQGVISGTPTDPDQDRTVTFRAMNSAGTADTTLAITINSAGSAPTISAIADVSESYNEAITAITVTVAGDPTPTVTVTGLPTGVTYSSGEISGTPTELGVHEITITAMNSVGTETEEFDLTVSREMLFFINDSNNIAIARDLDGDSLSIYNIALGVGDWYGGISLADGFYVIDNDDKDAIFFNLDRTPDTDRDITTDFETARNWEGGLGLSNGFYAIDNTGNEARFFNLNRTRNATGDITLGNGDWKGGLSLTDGFYFIDNEANEAIFYNLDRTTDSTKDIDLGTGEWRDGTAISDGFFIINDTNNKAVFYNLDRTTDTSRDIDLGTGVWNGCIAVDVTAEAPAGVPSISAIADIPAEYNEAMTAITVTVSGNPVPIVAVTGLPTGLSYSGGEITGTPTELGVHEVEITATNSEGVDVGTFNLTVGRLFMFAIDNTNDQARAIDFDGNVSASYNIELGSGFWRGGVTLSDGFYIIRTNPHATIFYNLDRTRDSNRDISLEPGVIWEGGFSLSDGFYIVSRTTNTARFYNLNRTRDTDRDIDLGDGSWTGGIGLTDGFYIIDNLLDTVRFYNLNRTRDSNRDIYLGPGGIWIGGFSLSDGFYIIEGDGAGTQTDARFYNLDRTSDPDRDIDMGAGAVQGAIAVYIISDP